MNQQNVQWTKIQVRQTIGALGIFLSVLILQSFAAFITLALSKVTGITEFTELCDVCIYVKCFHGGCVVRLLVLAFRLAKTRFFISQCITASPAHCVDLGGSRRLCFY